MIEIDVDGVDFEYKLMSYELLSLSTDIYPSSLII